MPQRSQNPSNESALQAITQLHGDWQYPVNRWQGAENSIHTDEVAKRVGMRGGTIPGTVHLSHFQPILTHLFGDRWCKCGSISMYYTFATTDREPVRAVVEVSSEARDNVQLAAWVENEEGKVVSKGTIAVGHPVDQSPYIRSLPLQSAVNGASRILANMREGAELPGDADYVVRDGTEGNALSDPQDMYRVLAIPPAGLVVQPAVGFFGGTEIILHNGPIEVGRHYKKTGKIACVGETPKTEFVWIDTFLHDENGKLVAEMRHMTRWMKASSPLWLNASAGR